MFTTNPQYKFPQSSNCSPHLTSSSFVKQKNYLIKGFKPQCSQNQISGNKENFYQDLTIKLLTLDEDELLQKALTKTEPTSLDYLLWLSQQENEKFEKLGATLTQIREEIENQQYTQIAQKVKLEEALTRVPQTGTQLEITKQKFLQIQQQANQLSETIRKSKETSTVQIIGRKKLESQEDIYQAMSLSDADRILQVLLQIHDKDARVETLKEACTPPTSQGKEDELNDTHDEISCDEEDILFTTPLQLLQSIQKLTAKNETFLQIPGYENIDNLKQEVEQLWQQSLH